jgi:hypothetical protein
MSAGATAEPTATAKTHSIYPPASLQGLLEPVAWKAGRPVLGPGAAMRPGLPDETYFSIVQRKVLTPNDFTSLRQVEQRLADFQPRYNATARPFQWKFTPADLDDLLARINRHQQQTTAPTTAKAA